MSNYSELLRKPEWQKKRLQILERDNWTCQLCGDTEAELQVHHKEYKGNPLKTPNDKLTTVCKHCHMILSADKSFGNLIFITKLKYGDTYHIKAFFPDTTHLYIIEKDKITLSTVMLHDVVIKIHEILLKLKEDGHIQLK